MTAPVDHVIGIDLGTTYSVVSVWDWDANRTVIITNEQGNRTTPSVVSYFRNDVFVGESAKNKIVVNPTNTIYNAKRLIGKMANQIRDEDKENWPFEVVATEDGRIRYQVFHRDCHTLVTPEEISGMVLNRLKGIAEKFLGTEVRRAVVTVPAYFTEPQKRATRDAANLAGLEVLHLLPEPTAAALAYGLDQRAMDDDKKQRMQVDGWHVLVFDLGGGTLDISILRLDGRGSFSVKAITGDFHLGGEDFDVMLMKFFAKRFSEYTNGVQLTAKGQSRLRSEAETIKRILSAAEEAVLDVQLEGVDFVCEITRLEMEELCGELFEDMMGEVDEALSLANLRPEDIDDVVLVGGSTRIPKVQQMLQTKFPTRPLWDGINPDEAVAWGAAIQAASLVANQRKTSAAQAAPPAAPSAPPKAPSQPPQPPKAPPTPMAKKFPQQPRGHHAHHHGHHGHHHHHHHGHHHHHHHQGHHHHRQHSQGPINATPTPAGKPLKTLPGSAPKPTAPSSILDSVVLSNVTPLTLGIELSDGALDPLVRRGTPIPTSVRDMYTTAFENQKSVIIRIYEGEKKVAKQNSLLGKFALQLPPAPAGVPKVEVTFDVTAEGLFTVGAQDTTTGKKTTVTIESGNLTNAEKKSLRIGGGGGNAGGAGSYEASAERQRLSEELVRRKEHILTLDPQTQQRLLPHCDALHQWLQEHPGAPASELQLRGELFVAQLNA